jgi:hypothetical protein
VDGFIDAVILIYFHPITCIVTGGLSPARVGAGRRFNYPAKSIPAAANVFKQSGIHTVNEKRLSKLVENVMNKEK